MKHQRPVSNEAEFEHWLASAFESERKRLRDRAEVSDPQPKPASERAVSAEKKDGGGVAAA